MEKGRGGGAGEKGRGGGAVEGGEWRLFWLKKALITEGEASEVMLIGIQSGDKWLPGCCLIFCRDLNLVPPRCQIKTRLASSSEFSAEILLNTTKMPTHQRFVWYPVDSSVELDLTSDAKVFVLILLQSQSFFLEQTYPK